VKLSPAASVRRPIDVRLKKFMQGYRWFAPG
jgi:hypothetical protein